MNKWLKHNIIMLILMAFALVVIMKLYDNYVVVPIGDEGFGDVYEWIEDHPGPVI